MNFLVQAIPGLMQESLSALSNSSKATKANVESTDQKLGQYEKALGITVVESATYGERIAAVAVIAAAAVTRALPAQFSHEYRATLSIEQLGQYSKDLTNALQLLTQLSSIIKDQQMAEPLSRATPEGVLVQYEDSRPGVAPHRAYVFRVEPSKGTVYEEIKELLGKEEADQLVQDWYGRCDLNQKLEVAIDVAIFLDSNNKHRKTQEDDFKAAGTSFSDDLALTLLSARKLRKARDGEQLSEAEKDLKQKQEGVIRSCSGALGIDAYGRLRAYIFFFGLSLPAGWASCSAPLPESK